MASLIYASPAATKEKVRERDEEMDTQGERERK